MLLLIKIKKTTICRHIYHHYSFNDLLELNRHAKKTFEIKLCILFRRLVIFVKRGKHNIGEITKLLYYEHTFKLLFYDQYYNLIKYVL